MFEGFESRSIAVADGIDIHTRIGGSGPPLLLLHGFPQTHVCWHKIAPHLAERFTVVATDLRGYGASSKPAGGAHHAAYSKRAMASDQLAVMKQLGFDRFSVVGHDRGGRVAHRLALDHANAVTRVSMLDIAPTETMYAATDRAFAQAYYHWFFLIQPFDLPERLIGAEPEFYLRMTLKSWCKTDGAITDDAIAAYLAAFTAAGAIHAQCEDYRAAASIDLKHDAADTAANRMLSMPLHVLWGSRGTVGKQFDVLETWRAKSNAAVTGAALDCGHFMPEEAPDETLAQLLKFLEPT